MPELYIGGIALVWLVLLLVLVFFLVLVLSAFAVTCGVIPTRVSSIFLFAFLSLLSSSVLFGDGGTFFISLVCFLMHLLLLDAPDTYNYLNEKW
mgnify:FL=1